MQITADARTSPRAFAQFSVRRFALLALLAGPVLAACDSKRQPLSPELASFAAAQRFTAGSIKITEDVVLDSVGASYQYTAEVTDARGRPIKQADVHWESQNPDIVSVNAKGLAVAIAVGATVITATSGDVSATSTVTVRGAPTEPGLPPAPVPTSIVLTPESATLASGDTLRVAAVVRDADGQPIEGASVTWTTSDAAVASVDAAGLVKAVAAGAATVTATSGAASASAGFTVNAPAPVPTSIVLTPERATLAPGDTLRVAAVVRDAGGQPIEGASVTWTTSDAAVASVDAAGLVKAVAAGAATVTATSGAASASAGFTVNAPPPPPPPPSEWDKVLENVSITGDVVVPAGQKWLIGANVQIAGNLRTTNGTIAMRPGSSLKFVGGDPAEYVGGGMMFEPRFARDIGLWVDGSNGVLDIRGTPKTGWNRTGVDPTWKSTDEYWIAPTAGDYTVRRWYPGQAIPGSTRVCRPPR
jgi:uncharacterized protein YjdB